MRRGLSFDRDLHRSSSAALRRLPVAIAWIVVFGTGSALAADASLSSLVESYREALRDVSGPPNRRAETVARRVAPVLTDIGKLDTKESLEFLLGELDGPRTLPDVAAACARPILASTNERAISFVLRGFGERPGLVQRAIFEAIGTTKLDVARAEKELLAAAAAAHPDARETLPRALGRLDSVAAAKSLLAGVKTVAPRTRGAAVDDGYRRGALDAISAMESSEVREWLADAAFAAVRSSTVSLEVLLQVIEKLRLEPARAEVIKLVSHSDAGVSSQALSALVALGIGSDSSVVAKAVTKLRGGSLDARIRVLDGLARSGEAAAISAVIEAAQSKDADLRAIALGSLALVADKNDDALKTLLGGLRDSEPSVRSVVVQALEKIRHKEMIEPLIEALDESSPYSVRVAALQLLVRRTGQNMGLVVEDWKKWWSVASARFEFPKDDDKKVTSVRTYGLEYFGIEIGSKRLAFVVDISSSMTEVVPVTRRPAETGPDPEPGKGRTRPAKPADPPPGAPKLGDKAKKIDILKVELARVLSKLPVTTAINIITFDGNFRSWQKSLFPLAGAGRSKAIDFVKGLATGSGTNVFDSLEFALQDRSVDTLYLMTDGNPTRGRLTDPDQIVAEIGKLNRTRGVTIHCIAFGEESKLLERLAAANGGQYRFVSEY
jgi:HEAT repeat protein